MSEKKVKNNNDVSAELANKLSEKIGKEIKIADKLGYGDDLQTDYTVTLDSVERLKMSFSVKIGGDYLNKVKDEFIKSQFLREKPAIQGFPANKMPPLVVLTDHYMNKFKKGYYKTVNNLFDYILITEIRRVTDFIKAKYEISNALDPQFDQLDPRNGVGQPEKTNYAFEDYSFKFSMETFPELPKVDVTKLSIDYPKAKITDADVKKSMQEWADNNVRGVPLTVLRPVQAGDTVILDLNIPGKKETLDNFKVVVGNGKLNPDLEEKLIAKNVGDKFEYNFGLPKDFPDASIAGRSFNITVVIKDIQATENFKLDDEMAAAFGCKDFAECAEKFKTSLTEQTEKLSLFAAKNNLEKVLGEAFSIELPQAVIDDEMLKRCDRLAKEIGTNLHYPMPDEEKAAIKDKMIEIFGYDFDKWQANELVSVESDLRAMLQIMEYTKENKIQLTTKELDDKIASHSDSFKGGLKEAVQYFEQNPKAKQNMAREVLEEKVLKALLKDVKTKDAEMSLDDLAALVRKGNRVNLLKSVGDKPNKTPSKKESEKKVEKE